MKREKPAARRPSTIRSETPSPSGSAEQPLLPTGTFVQRVDSLRSSRFRIRPCVTVTGRNGTQLRRLRSGLPLPILRTIIPVPAMDMTHGSGSGAGPVPPGFRPHPGRSVLSVLNRISGGYPPGRPGTESIALSRGRNPVCPSRTPCHFPIAVNGGVAVARPIHRNETGLWPRCSRSSRRGSVGRRLSSCAVTGMRHPCTSSCGWPGKRSGTIEMLQWLLSCSRSQATPITPAQRVRNRHLIGKKTGTETSRGQGRDSLTGPVPNGSLCRLPPMGMRRPGSELRS